MLSLFAHGAAQAGSEVLNKYIDEEMQQRKAEAMADLQRKTAGAIREDDAAFQDKRAPVLQQRALDSARATAGLQDEIAAKRLDPNSPLYKATVADEERKAAAGTKRKIDEQTQMLSNPDLLKAQRDKAAGDATAQADAQMNLAKRMASDTEYLKAQEKIKLSDPAVKANIEQSRAAAASAYASAANSRAHAAHTQAQTESVKRVDAIYADMLKTIDDKSLSPEQRAEKLTTLQSKLVALTPGKAGANAEFDTVKITEEKINPDGSTTKVERTEKRKAGAGGGKAGDAPYPDGTELRGKDGNVYVVRNGQPVLKDAQKDAQKPSAPAPRPVPKEAPAGSLETTKTPSGGTVYRYKGQDRWYSSKVEAMTALGSKREEDQIDPNLTRMD